MKPLLSLRYRFWLQWALVASLCFSLTPRLQAQVVDTFADGDHVNNPPWSGDTQHVEIVPFGADYALRSNGPARSDTLALTTPSTTTYGSWSFTLAYDGGRTSNFNMVRFYLRSDGPSLDDAVTGEYLQVGTNRRDVRLYRTAPSGRSLLGQSAANLLDQEADTLVFRVERTPFTWTVYLEGAPLLDIADPSPPAGPSTHLGWWVKHSSARGSSFLLDEIVVTPSTTDPTPPTLQHVEVRLPQTLFVRFDEPVRACDPRLFAVAPDLGIPIHVTCPEEDASTYTLEFAEPFQPGASYTLRATNISDLYGNRLDHAEQVFMVPDAVIPSQGDLVINEIWHAPPDASLEFVELYNRASVPFDVRLLALADNRDQPVPLTSTPYLLAPDAYVVLARDSLALAGLFPDIPILGVADWPTLNNGGDTVTLSALGSVVDQVTYSSAWGEAGRSLERIDPAGPSASVANWEPSQAVNGATPGVRNSVYAPDRTPPRLTFAEQTGPNDLLVYFDEPLDRASISTSLFRVGAQTAANVWVLANGQELHLRFPAPLPNQVSLVVEDIQDPTGNRAGRQSLPIALRLNADVLGDAIHGALVLTEIFYDPRADPQDGLIDQPEYLELWNPTAWLLSLRGTYWTDRPDESGASDTTRVTTAPLALPPDSRAVIYADPHGVTGTDAYAQSTLVAAFPEDYRSAGTVLVPLDRSSLGLANEGERIRLHGPDGAIVDAVTYSPDGHDAGRATTRGLALERIDLHAPPVATNWTTSLAPEGGTPGFPNSVSPAPEARQPLPGDLVFNELMIAPRADPDDHLPDQPEYIELMNRSDAPLTLQGLLIANHPDEKGIADTVRIGFAPEVLAPGGFATVFRVSPAHADPDRFAVLTIPFPTSTPHPGTGVALPSRRLFPLPNTSDHLYLLARDSTTVLDAIPYSAAWHHPNLVDARGTSLERVSAEGRSDDPTNWTSSVSEEGGTPNAPNSVALGTAASTEQPGLSISPSPFSPDLDGFEDQTVIRWSLTSTPALVRVRIFDSRGRLVRTLTEAQLSAATGQIVWDGLDDASRELRIGIYVVLVEALDTTNGTAEAFKQAVVLARPLD